ncbi:unnamed protein product [Tilletia controversa]|nr:unnamed protein product [Tilletia controversa]CAD6915924.1 unnamed protein product [Tilletia caries]CAD6965365.1 unnamed protein product [Tilletia laevis]CAD6927149.1 unnamed protein product [Tilletia controversa]CAD6950524.1 unnamed protein product [Tilletia caries]
MLAAMAAGELDPVLKAEGDFYVEYFSGHRGAERIIEDASRYIHFFIRKAYRNETDYYHQLYLINPQLPFYQTPQPGFSWSPTNGVMAVIPTN